jgi:hypothetical protein
VRDAGGIARSARRLVVLLLAMSLVSVGERAFAAEEDPAAARRDVQRRRAAAAADVDVLRASDAEIERALADLRQNIRRQERRAAAARQEAAVAAAALQRAKDAQARTEQRLSDLREEMRGVAVEAYVAGPVQGLAIAVEARSFNDLANRRYLLEVTAAKAAETTDRLRAARQDFRLQRRQAAAAADRADAQEDQVEEELRALQEAEATQARVAQSVEVRLEQSLAEAAALAALDERLAVEIAARQARIAAELAARRPQTVAAPAATTPSTVTSAPTRSPTTTAPTTAPSGEGRATTTTTTAAPPRQSRPSSAPALTTVRGITVATSLADDLRALLEAADADGFSLSGGGYRSSDAQVEARRANCGPSDYDIYEKPASECDPPTARPGQSMHEQGLAVDFTSDGRLIESRSDRAFLWLSRNAARFGLYNLPREPWHWSTNGN